MVEYFMGEENALVGLDLLGSKCGKMSRESLEEHLIWDQHKMYIKWNLNSLKKLNHTVLFHLKESVPKRVVNGQCSCYNILRVWLLILAVILTIFLSEMKYIYIYIWNKTFMWKIFAENLIVFVSSIKYVHFAHEAYLLRINILLHESFCNLRGDMF